MMLFDINILYVFGVCNKGFPEILVRKNSEK